MCGIFGYVRREHLGQEIRREAFDIQGHRGPDDRGEKEIDYRGWKVFFGHQRLSILDLTKDGHQPMTNEESGDTIAYNGELYNYLELKTEMSSEVGFSSRCDTEVFLKGLNRWGVSKALGKYNGMWAFSLFRERDGMLFLARDRMGEKPLHVYCGRDEFYFASELKTLVRLLNRKLDLDNKTIADFMVNSLISHTPNTFFQGVQQIKPADLLNVRLRNNGLEFSSSAYWTCDTGPVDEDQKVAQRRIRELFVDSVRIRLRSDVPVGVLLSGGIDSSAIAGVAARECGGEGLAMLSGVSNIAKWDESPYIDEVVGFLGTDSERLQLQFDPDVAFDSMERCVHYNDVPINNYSLVAYYYLMERAREKGLTVILSGQGADELLCGYRKYLAFYWQRLRRTGRYLGLGKSVYEFCRTGSLISQMNLSEASRYLPSFHARKTNPLGERLMNFETSGLGLLRDETVQERQLRDMHQFSVPALTHYEDRLSMAHSREVRLPFLDHRLIEYVLPLSIDNKLNRGWSKYGFRMALQEYMPPAVTWRKDKQGFGNPQGLWLKNEWKGKVLDLFADEALIFKYRLMERETLLRQYREYCSQSGSFGRVWYRDILHAIGLEFWLRQNYDWISG